MALSRARARHLLPAGLLALACADAAREPIAPQPLDWAREREVGRLLERLGGRLPDLARERHEQRPRGGLGVAPARPPRREPDPARPRRARERDSP